MALAEQFKVAVERKEGERRGRMYPPPRYSSAGTSANSANGKAGEGGEEIKGGGKGEGEQGEDGREDEEDGEGLISYTVFVLDATAEEMMERVPHLMVRLQGAKGSANSSSHAEDEDGEAAAGEVEELLSITENNDNTSPISDTTTPSADTTGTETNAHTIAQDGLTRGERGSSAEAKAKKPNTIDFALREKEEMRDLTRASEILSVVPVPGPVPSDVVKEGVVKENGDGDARGVGVVDFSGTTTASHWDPTIGQVFLGNSNDVPIVPDPPRRRVYLSHTTNPLYHHLNGDSNPHNGDVDLNYPHHHDNDDVDVQDDPFEYKATNDPAKGFGYDICVECHEVAPFPSTTHLRAADEHLQMLDALWVERHQAGEGAGERERELPVRPPPNANAIIHLPFPSSPPSTAAAVASLLPFLKFLERVLQPVPPSSPTTSGNNNTSNSANQNGNSTNNNNSTTTGHSRRWSSVSSLMPSLPLQSYQGLRSRSSTSPSLPSPHPPKRTRPLKVLIYYPDGYTESSVPALCLLMALRRLLLPEAYLELQVNQRRSGAFSCIRMIWGY